MIVFFCYETINNEEMSRILKWLPKENLTIAREWLRVEAFSFSLVEMIIFSLTCVLNWVKIWVQSFPVGVVVVETETFFKIILIYFFFYQKQVLFIEIELD